MVINTIITIIYLLMILALIILLIGHLFKTEKITDKISIAVVLVMFILRLFLIK